MYYPQQFDLEEKRIKKEFFVSIKLWRSILIKYISKNYPHKYDPEILSQKILDRMIFIEVCHDKGTISEDILGQILESKVFKYTILLEKFKQMDELFNSELFAISEPDEIKISDEIIIPIIKGLSKIDFSKLSVNIIGEVYENYLGELQRASSLNKEKMKRKSQGIYYTPEFVIDVIVENTVGAVLKKCKTISELQKIKVLDPACGSGSFLIRVFDEFLKHYRRIDDRPLLEFHTRKDILVNNIYGVDIDDRAVEIAKLNLLVKTLENTSHLDLSGRKLLPNLKLNIRCGNSLVFGDNTNDISALSQKEYRNDLLELRKYHERFHSDPHEEQQKEHYNKILVIEESINTKLNKEILKRFKNPDKIKPFNYVVAFPEVFNNGGFDCVIGNPPYIDSERMTTEQPEVRQFISEHYKFTKGNWDIYIAFYERAYMLTNDSGYWSYITPDKWIAKPFGDALRATTTENILYLYRVGRKVFADAKVDSIISIFSKKPSKGVKIYDYGGINFKLVNDVPKNIISPPYFYDVLFSSSLPILAKIENAAKDNRFKLICENACATSDAYKLKPFILGIKNGTYQRGKHYKVINTGTIGRYANRWGYKEMTYLGNKYLFPVVNRKEFESKFKNTYGGKASKPKIIIKSLTLLDASLDIEGEVVPGKSTLIVFADNAATLKYLSAIINSELAFFYISEKYPSSSYNQGINFTKDMIKNLPVPIPSERILNKVVLLVDEIIPLYNSLYRSDNKTNNEKLLISIAAKEREINNVVYGLYGLTNEEIKVVERANE